MRVHSGTAYGLDTVPRQRDGWWRLAACRNGDPDALFVAGAEQNLAKKVCTGCPVRLDCLAYALDGREPYGVWGGLTETARRRLLAAHPEVVDWRRWLTDLAAAQGALEPARRNPCGTRAAYQRHIYHHEEVDEACRAAQRAYMHTYAGTS